MSKVEPSPESATHHWDELARRIEGFLAAWETSDGPPIADHVPAEPRELKRLAIVELIKVDLEQRACRQLPKRLEEYMAEFPELLEAGEPPVDLIYEELHVRRSAGEQVRVEEYFARFPRSQDALKKLLGDGLAASSCLFGGWPTKRDRDEPADATPARWLGQFAAGQQLEDFDLLAELGRGAFGQVFLARQRSMQRLVALKISAERGDEPQTLAQLDHPHIVRVYDQKRLEKPRLRLLYMQYVPGGTLADVIAAARPKPPSERRGAEVLAATDAAMQKAGQVVDDAASWRRRVREATWPETVCRIGVQLARALEHAHRQGVLHRDVKPANVLLAADGSPKLADFNISFGSHVKGATPAAYFGGSLAYMSPEQIEACDPKHSRKAEELDGRSDLYSLAVVLWELLFGFRPFHDAQLDGGWNDTLKTMAQRRRDGTIEMPPDALDSDPVARRQMQVLRRALSPKPEDRHPNGAALARDLALCLHGQSWELVRDISGGWQRLARSRPLLLLVAVNVLPHAFAGAFNYAFNKATLIDVAESAAIREWFPWVSIAVNGIAFPLGVILGVAYCWRFVQTLLRVRRGERVSADELAWARQRGLSLGQIIAAIGVGEWLIAGMLWPIIMHLLAGDFPASGYFHFFLSLAACGLIAAAFPYLGTMRLAVRVFYPMLLGTHAPEPTEAVQLEAIPQQAARFLFLAAVVPLVAVGLVLLSRVEEGRLWSGLLIGASVAGLVAAYFTYQRICRDVAALSYLARPVETLGTASESFET